MLVHHTGCGMETLTEDFRHELEDEVGQRPAWAVESFRDADQDVRQSMQRVRTSPFLPHTDDVRGFVFDVTTGLLREIDPAAEPVIHDRRNGQARSGNCGRIPLSCPQASDTKRQRQQECGCDTGPNRSARGVRISGWAGPFEAHRPVCKGRGGPGDDL